MTIALEQAERCVRGAWHWSMLALLAAVLAPASGAERVVLCEEFSRTTCPYCATAAGPALDWMVSKYPTTFAFVQIHTSPTARTTPWGNSRMAFYSIPGVPAAWFDGVDDYVGAYGYDPNNGFPYGDPNANFEVYETEYLSRRAVPTDVTIALEVVKVSDDTRYASARVAIEPGGQGKTLRIQMVQVLDHWPAVATYSRNGLRQGAAPQDITLSPGGSALVTNTFTLGDDSLSDEANVKIIVWAQAPSASATAEVYNAAFVTGPFQYLTGDMNCDGVISYADINPFVLALSGQASYEAQFPSCSWLNADTGHDGSVSYADINPFVALLSAQ
jgi:hypothetical protein